MDFLAVLAILACSVVISQSIENVQEQFFVKPGGKTEIFEKTLGDYKCTFSYQAQGGTHENWHFMMEVLNDGEHLMCSVARGQTSYLYFMTFTMSVSGPGLSIEHSEAINTGNTQLEATEYKMDSKKKSISAVPDKFKNHLEKVVLYASMGKTEL